MMRGCPHINWWSFIPILKKIDGDITKIKKTFLEDSPQLFERSEENLSRSLLKAS